MVEGEDYAEVHDFSGVRIKMPPSSVDAVQKRTTKWEDFIRKEDEEEEREEEEAENGVLSSIVDGVYQTGVTLYNKIIFSLS